MTRQQIEFYTQEYQRALEGVKDSNWRITKEMCAELRKLQNPSQQLVEICEKAMLVLDLPEKSFQGFRKIIKNFGFLKDAMSSIKEQVLPDSVINEILPIWKNQPFIQSKLLKTSRCVCLLAQWLGFIVEYSLKKETVNSSKKRIPELEKKIIYQTDLTNELNKQLTVLKDEALRYQKLIECKIELESKEFNESFKIIPQGECKISEASLYKNSCSEGLIPKPKNSLESNFPNFNDNDLYDGINFKDSEEQMISYEGTHEIGCCRMKFFCF